MEQEVRFKIKVPEGVTNAQLDEFLEYELGLCATCSLDNPLVNGYLDQLQPSNLRVNWKLQL